MATPSERDAPTRLVRPALALDGAYKQNADHCADGVQLDHVSAIYHFGRSNSRRIQQCLVGHLSVLSSIGNGAAEQGRDACLDG